MVGGRHIFSAEHEEHNHADMSGYFHIHKKEVDPLKGLVAILGREAEPRIMRL
jgi:hypothetical protein